jgi:hypothetical protein
VRVGWSRVENTDLLIRYGVCPVNDAEVGFALGDQVQDGSRTLGDFKNYPQFLGVFGNLRASRFEGSADTFQARRARISFMGHLFDPDFKYFIQPGAESSEDAANASGVQLLDWNFQFTRWRWANVWAGQYKVHITRTGF